MEEQQAVLEGEQGEVVEPQNNEATTEATSEPVESAPTEDAGKDGVQKRIDKITAEKYGYKRQVDDLKDELNQLKTSPSTEVVQPQGKPTLEQFDFDEGQYQSALISYEVDQRLTASREAAKKEQATLKRQEIDSAYDANEGKYATENPEYVNDVQNLPRFNNDTLSMIKAQENAPNLVHYLGKNLDLANTIASLDPINAAVQVGIISAKLSAPIKPAVTPSTAADPIDPISSGGSVSTENNEHGVVYE